MNRERKFWNYPAFLVVVMLLFLYISKTAGNVDLFDIEKSLNMSMGIYESLKKSGENIIFSPICVQIAMALAYTGAKENTAKEIEDTYKFPDINETLNRHLEIMGKLAIPELKMANKMYVDESLALEENYEEDVKQFFFSTTGKVLFKNGLETVAEINNWVASQTNNKIQDIIKPAMINDDTSLILLNAIYFKADWKFPFLEESTSLKKFHVSTTESVDVDTMSIRHEFPYEHSEALQATIIALPYSNNNIDMLIILPDEIDGLEQVEEYLARNGLSEELKTLKSRGLDLQLPKFKIESTISDLLKQALEKLGIKNLFSNADFSGISKQLDSVSVDLIQKAFVEINEKGTEAAASSGVLVSVRYMPSFKLVEANHPFLFVIKQDDIVLFQGRYVTPDS